MLRSGQPAVDDVETRCAQRREIRFPEGAGVDPAEEVGAPA